MKLIARIFGAPMAAPETPSMRHLRFSVISLCASSALSVAGVDVIASLCGRAAAGAIVLAMLGVTAATAILFLIRKTRIDDAWLMDRGFDRQGDGA
jgi:uncharacterized membrane protein YuzA (DUF378 family)